MLSQKNVLVLGSKPDSVLPDLQVSSIYTANGAAERAKIYKEKYPNTPLICCAGARVDRYLIKRIDNKLKKRIFSLDRELVKIADVNYWKGNFF